MNIIAVDDEALPLHDLKTAIKEALPNENPTCFRKPSEALIFAQQTPIDIAFLDIEMGSEMNGLELAQKLTVIHRETNIIFVTGFSKYSEAAHELYASGYVKKPVLAKRILKEISHLRYPIQAKAKALGPYVIDHTTGRVYRDGKDTLLGPREFQLFCLFTDNPGLVFTAEELYQKIWGDEPVGSIDTVKIHISRLRQKLDMAQSDCAEIKALRGKGYMLEWMPGEET